MFFKFPLFAHKHSEQTQPESTGHTRQSNNYQYLNGFLSDFKQTCIKEGVFGLQLIFFFFLAMGSAQVLRDWAGLTTPAETTTTARVIWPSNQWFKFPQAPTSSQLASAAAENKRQQQAQLYRTAPAAPLITQTARTSVQRLPNAQAPLQLASRLPRAQQSDNSRVLAWTPQKRAPLVKSAVKTAPTPKNQARKAAPPSEEMLNVRKMLVQDYGVRKLKSYDSYMNWARETLQEYRQERPTRQAKSGR